MKFTKMHGAGNDFIIIDNREENLTPERASYVAKTLCQRRLSIGADGMMLVDAAQAGGDYRMTFYNSDGSLGEMCGNGARCIARYGFERGLAGETQHIETTAGMVKGWRQTERQYKVRLNDVTKLQLVKNVTAAGGQECACSYIELGDPPLPHAAVEIEGLEKADRDKLRTLGRDLRNSPDFPKGANINFYDIIGEDLVRELTYERGVEDFTYACGTGTGSMVAALTIMGRVSGNNVKVLVPGGELFITIERDGDRITDVYLTGPTDFVAEGTVLDEDL